MGAYQSKIPADDLAESIDAVIAGYAGTFDQEAPTVAVQFRAKMGIYANNEFEAYSKWKIGQNKSNAAAVLYAGHVQTDQGGHPQSVFNNTPTGGN